MTRRTRSSGAGLRQAPAGQALVCQALARQAQTCRVRAHQARACHAWRPTEHWRPDPVSPRVTRQMSLLGDLAWRPARPARPAEAPTWARPPAAVPVPVVPISATWITAVPVPAAATRAPAARAPAAPTSTDPPGRRPLLLVPRAHRVSQPPGARRAISASRAGHPHPTAARCLTASAASRPPAEPVQNPWHRPARPAGNRPPRPWRPGPSPGICDMRSAPLKIILRQAACVNGPTPARLRPASGRRGPGGGCRERPGRSSHIRTRRSSPRLISPARPGTGGAEHRARRERRPPRSASGR